MDETPTQETSLTKLLSELERMAYRMRQLSAEAGAEGENTLSWLLKCESTKAASLTYLVMDTVVRPG